MFSKIEQLPADSLLGLIRLFAEDKHEQKVDLGVGAYRTPDNHTPVMKAVTLAQTRVLEAQTSKVYVAPDGVPGFCDHILKLVFGAEHPALTQGRLTGIQTPGGCGALRIGADLLKRQNVTRIVCGAPTWPNHVPLISAADVPIEMAPFYDRTTSRIDFTAFMEEVEKLGPNDALLLHGACHNPTGADLTKDQINSIIDAADRRGFLPFIDMAYHGFAEDLDVDAYIVREMARRLPEFLLSYSCSKNFGLYRERTGGLFVLGQTTEAAQAVKSHMLSFARGVYSMPPAHGGHIVAEILSSKDLSKIWQEELSEMCKAVKNNRARFAATARDMGMGDSLNFVEYQNGMFSLLPLTEAQVMSLRTDYGIYLAGSGRANMCGINEGNVDYLCAAYRDVTTGSKSNETTVTG
jgi:aspartate/tyrosine/aromatic aminotransferase